MITPYAKSFPFDSLMEKLYQEIQSHGRIPLINQIKKEDEYPFRVLISTVLSSRTKDKVTAQASERLFLQAPNPQKLSLLTEEKIAKLIYPVGFYRVKSKNIRKIASILLNKYKGVVPNNFDDLLELPGVGRKTANLVLGVAFNVDAITVDIHVHRISNRIGLIKTKTPLETEYGLQIILPKKYWISFNSHLVAHGQNICKPVSPVCSKCKITDYCKKVGVNKYR